MVFLSLSLSLQALLQLNPYHIDSLLQLSDVCRIQEDQEMARDLIGGCGSINNINSKPKMWLSMDNEKTQMSNIYIQYF